MQLLNGSAKATQTQLVSSLCWMCSPHLKIWGASSCATATMCFGFTLMAGWSVSKVCYKVLI